MVLLIYKDWTKLNTVRPAEVWCAKVREEVRHSDWLNFNDEYFHTAVVVRILSTGNLESMKDETPQESVYDFIIQLKMYMLFKLW